MTIEFNCPSCSKLLRTADDKAGSKAKCPGCGEPIVVPSGDETHDAFVTSDVPNTTSGPADESAEEMTVCPMCGGENYSDAVTCYHCGEELGRQHGELAPTRIDAGEVISTSWSIFQSQMGLCIGGFLIVLVCAIAIEIPGAVLDIAAANGLFGREPHATYWLLNFGLVMVTLAFQLFMNLGQTVFFLKIARGEPAEIGDLFSAGRFWLRGVGNTFVFGVVVVIGYLLCIVPGILLTLMLWPYLYVIVDTDARGLEPLSRSKEITSGNWGAVFVIWIASFGLAILGALTCGVGLLFTLPLTTVFMAVAYCRMTGQPTVQV